MKHRGKEQMDQAFKNAREEYAKHPSGTSAASLEALRKARPCPCKNPNCSQRAIY